MPPLALDGEQGTPGKRKSLLLEWLWLHVDGADAAASSPLIRALLEPQLPDARAARDKLCFKEPEARGRCIFLGNSLQPRGLLGMRGAWHVHLGGLHLAAHWCHLRR